MNILILGGSGFIGSYLTECLINKHRVTVLSQSNISNKIENCEYKVFSYSEKNFLEYLRKNQFDVIHFLSGNPHPSFSEIDLFVDVDLTIRPALSMLKALREIAYKGIVWFSSSVAVYGKCSDIRLSENSICEPLSNYAVAKITVENYAKLYAQNYGLKIGIYRIFSTFGPGLNRQVIYDNIVKMRSGVKSILLISSEDSARDFSYVKDQALAIEFLNDNVVPRADIFNLGSGKPIKIIDVVRLIADILAYNGDVSCQKDSRMLHDVSWTADVGKISSLGFQQTFSLRAGLEETVRKII
jgi:nucleoside-diphosphate-sugar epimerase